MHAAAVIRDLPHEDYHADLDGPSLSQSVANRLLESPLNAYAEHPRLGGKSRPPTKAQKGGSLMHGLVTGVMPPMAILDYQDYRKKEAQIARDEAMEAGLQPVLRRELEAAQAQAADLRDRLTAMNIDLAAMEKELTIVTPEVVDGVEIRLKSRLDFLELADDYATIWDLKFVASADPNRFWQSMLNFGYDVQRAAYVEAVERAFPHLAGRVEMWFLLVETDTPARQISICRPAGSMRSRGEFRWRRAKGIWARCLSTGIWPGWSEEIHEIECPPWALTEELLASPSQDPDWMKVE